MTADEQLRWEARWRVPAAVCAAAAGLLLLAGSLVELSVSRDNLPDITSQLLFVHKHAGGLLLATVVSALGALALAGPLLYLYRATKFRRPQTPNVAQAMALIGPAAAAISQLAFYFVRADKASAFATHGSQTYEEAKRIFDSTEVLIPQYIGIMSLLALGFAFVIISLNAMRVGLLTRFMGILGIIVGVLSVIQLDSPGVVRFFWLGALALLISGRWPNGVPPAWSSGQAEPWPSQQELREERERAKGNAPAPKPEPAPAAASAATGSPHPTSKKRKRKKRR